MFVRNATGLSAVLLSGLLLTSCVSDDELFVAATEQKSTGIDGGGWIYTGGNSNCFINYGPNPTYGQWRTWCWGANQYGQLGDGTLINRTSPVQVGGPLQFWNLAIGYKHSCGISFNPATGTKTGIWCWGQNDYGQIGDNSLTDRTAPVLVLPGLPDGTPPVAVAVGFEHTCAAFGNTGQLTRIYCWGRNDRGQLGDNTFINKKVPVPVSLPANVVTSTQLSLGDEHSCINAATTSQFYVPYCWGRNLEGQLGDGTYINKKVPVRAGGSLVTSYYGLQTGGWHTAFHTAYPASCTSPGTWGLYATGWNAYGQLGDGTLTTRNSPVLMTGTLGSNTTQDVYLTSAGGWSHQCARKESRSGCSHTDVATQCTGMNTWGQLGIGSLIDKKVLTNLAGGYTGGAAAGGYHGCGVSAVGAPGSIVYEFRCWGDNSLGQLGDGTLIQQTSPHLSFTMPRD